MSIVFMLAKRSSSPFFTKQAATNKKSFNITLNQLQVS